MGMGEETVTIREQDRKGIDFTVETMCQELTGMRRDCKSPDKPELEQRGAWEVLCVTSRNYHRVGKNLPRKLTQTAPISPSGTKHIAPFPHCQLS